ncbi:MAG: DUF3078 domain-containing protein [Bacteroidales bacterium]|nr:DUF3078 domain-containing protein [Bacteroidales bacterium]
MKGRLARYIAVAVLLLFTAAVSSFAQVKNNLNEEALQEAKLSNLNTAQELCRVIGAQFDVPTINYEPVTPPKFWTKGMLTELGFSQISLTNWAAGGSGSLALNSYVNAHANYAKGDMFWDNRGQLSYGFVQSFQDGYRKSDDKIVLDSKWGYKAINKFYFSANFNFRSQFTPGFEYSGDKSTKVSQMFAPAYLTLGLGIDFKPGNGKEFSLNFAPLTGNLVIVTDSLLRAKYGNKPDEAARWALGAQLKATLNKDIFKNMKVNTTLALFSDYLNKPQNIQINWDFQLTYKLNKYFQTGLRTNLIYDDNILITDKDGHAAPRVQFKEVFSVNFAYTFGMFKK